MLERFTALIGITNQSELLQEFFYTVLAHGHLNNAMFTANVTVINLTIHTKYRLIGKMENLACLCVFTLDEKLCILMLTILFSLERCMIAQAASLFGCCHIHHNQLLVWDIVLSKPLLGLWTIFLQARCHEIFHRTLRFQLEWSMQEEVSVARAIIILLR